MIRKLNAIIQKANPYKECIYRTILPIRLALCSNTNINIFKTINNNEEPNAYWLKIRSDVAYAYDEHTTLSARASEFFYVSLDKKHTALQRELSDSKTLPAEPPPKTIRVLQGYYTRLLIGYPNYYSIGTLR